MSTASCTVHLILRRAGHERKTRQLYDAAPTVERFKQDLEAYEKWFTLPLADPAIIGKPEVKTKRGKRWKAVPLRREDAATSGVHKVSVLGAEWINTKRNQLKAIVVNALLAGYLVKRMLVLEMGPGAMSLGTTGVERGWWLHHLANINRAGIWATNAWKQYRVTATWKKEVRLGLRAILTMIDARHSGPNREAAQLADLIEELSDTLLAGPREPILLRNATPITIADDSINVGLDVFRKQMS